MRPEKPLGTPEDRETAFLSEIESRRKRKEENDRDSSFWSSVGMMGTVGWSVALPTALGVLFGRWLDGRLDSGYVFMVFFLLVGVAVGCVIAWRTVSLACR